MNSSFEDFWGVSMSIPSAVLAGLCAGVVVYLMFIVRKNAGEDKYDSKTYALLVPMIGATVFTIMVSAQAAYKPFMVPKDITPWIYLILTGVFFAFTNLAIYNAFQQKIQLSIFTIILRLNIVLVLIVGVIMFKEVLDPLKLAGIILILTAVIMLSFNKKDKHTLKTSDREEKYSITKGSLFALAAVVTITMAVTFNKLSLNDGMPVLVTSLGNYLFQIPFLFSITRLSKVFEIIKSCTKLIAVWAVFVAIGWGGYIYALQVGNISLVQPIFQGLQIVVPALLGFFFLKENEQLHKSGKLSSVLISIVFTVVGIILVSIKT